MQNSRMDHPLGTLWAMGAQEPRSERQQHGVCDLQHLFGVLPDQVQGAHDRFGQLFVLSYFRLELLFVCGYFFCLELLFVWSYFSSGATFCLELFDFCLAGGLAEA